MNLFSKYGSWNPETEDFIAKNGIFSEIDKIYDKLRDLGFDRAETIFIVVNELSLRDAEYSLIKAAKMREAEKKALDTDSEVE